MSGVLLTCVPVTGRTVRDCHRVSHTGAARKEGRKEASVADARARASKQCATTTAKGKAMAAEMSPTIAVSRRVVPPSARSDSPAGKRWQAHPRGSIASWTPVNWFWMSAQ